ncbi:MAG: mobile mystery protein A [Hyphomicrobiales bacterium]|nr:mobile mystery protein A [Hyphomicrobiales bacterium]
MKALSAITRNSLPPRGWIRAIRDALGMTTVQLARRLGVSQPRITELEKSELSGSISMRSLRRAAEALGCQVVYVLVPNKPLEMVLRQRAESLASEHSGAVEHSMRLEAQAVHGGRASEELHSERVENLLRHPARLWDDE